MDRFDSDVMDDLMLDAAEGPAQFAIDDFDGADEADEFDALEDDGGDDEFLGRLLGGVGRAAAGMFGDGGDGFDEDDGFDEADGFDEFDDSGDVFTDGDGFDEDGVDAAVAEALDAADGDEFFRRLRNIARRVGRGIGSAARVVGPLASMIPLPQAQLIGRIANVAGRLLADGADEFELFDDFVDGLDADGIDAAAPVLAGMVIRRALPDVARAAPRVRRAAVSAVAGAVRQAARRQGPQAARSVARAVQASRRIAQQRRLPSAQALRVMRGITRQVVARPQVMRRLARPLVATPRRATPRPQAVQAVARAVAPLARNLALSAPAAGRRAGTALLRPACPYCRSGRHLVTRGPITIQLRCR